MLESSRWELDYTAEPWAEIMSIIIVIRVIIIIIIKTFTESSGFTNTQVHCSYTVTRHSAVNPACPECVVYMWRSTTHSVDTWQAHISQETVAGNSTHSRSLSLSVEHPANRRWRCRVMPAAAGRQDSAIYCGAWLWRHLLAIMAILYLIYLVRNG